MNWVEVVGYIASVIIMIGLTQSRVLYLRAFSWCGSIVFIIYALLIGSVPLLITNVVLLGLNTYHLWRILSGREEFALLEVSTDSAYLRRFLEFHADDIAASQPDFAGVRPNDTVVMVLRNMVPTVLIVGRPHDGIFQVFLDYAIPNYRDFKGGKWLFDRRADLFNRLGTDTIVATGRTDGHRRYLSRAGFEPGEDDKWSRPVGKRASAPA